MPCLSSCLELFLMCVTASNRYIGEFCMLSIGSDSLRERAFQNQQKSSERCLANIILMEMLQYMRRLSVWRRISLCAIPSLRDREILARLMEILLLPCDIQKSNLRKSLKKCFLILIKKLFRSVIILMEALLNRSICPVNCPIFFSWELKVLQSVWQPKFHRTT